MGDCLARFFLKCADTQSGAITFVLTTEDPTACFVGRVGEYQDEYDWLCYNAAS